MNECFRPMGTATKELEPSKCGQFYELGRTFFCALQLTVPNDPKNSLFMRFPRVLSVFPWETRTKVQ